MVLCCGSSQKPIAFGWRIEGRFRNGVHVCDVSDLMRWLVKEDLLKFDGKSLFPERRAHTIQLQGKRASAPAAFARETQRVEQAAMAEERGERREERETTIQMPKLTPHFSTLTPPPVLRRFYGSVDLDAMRINRDAAAIANEVVQHLTALHGATVKITLEIEAEIPDGVPDDVVRAVTENCNTLRFKSRSFEPE